MDSDIVPCLYEKMMSDRNKLLFKRIPEEMEAKMVSIRLPNGMYDTHVQQFNTTTGEIYIPYDGSTTTEYTQRIIDSTNPFQVVRYEDLERLFNEEMRRVQEAFENYQPPTPEPVQECVPGRIPKRGKRLLDI